MRGDNVLVEKAGADYRLTNIQAAMGCAQMENLDNYISIKRRIAGDYTRALEGISSITPIREAPWAFSIFWLFTVLVNENTYGMDSRGLLKRLASAGIQARPLWQPLHLSPAHAGSLAIGGEVAEKLNHQALSLPCSVGLTEEQRKKVIHEIISAPERA
jgi:perosamine synthetase